MIDPTTKIEAEPEVISCGFGDGQALLDLRNGAYFTLNSVGAFVWLMLGAPVTVAEISSAIMQRYDAEAAQCAADLDKLLHALAAAKLIRLSDAAA